MGKSLILNFHNEINGALFERIILALRSRYQLISLEQLEQLLLQKKRLKNICHISFDDGERSFYQVVFPILKKYNVPASLFLSPDIVSYGKNFWFQEAKGYDNGIMKSLIVKRLGIALEGIKKFSYLEIFKSLPINDIIELIEAYQQQTLATCQGF